MCDAGANAFIERYFRDCIYTTRDAIGFSFGMASICCWLVAQLPQFVLNIRNKSVEALSSWFLAQWLLGDTCNLVGCLLTDSQLPTQTYTAMYFILADMWVSVPHTTVQTCCLCSTSCTVHVHVANAGLTDAD